MGSSNLNILVIDDDESIRESLGKALEKAKYIVASANDGDFDNFEVSSGKVTTKEGLGRSALVDEFKIVDESVLGNDKVSKMKRLGVYEMLSNYLCSGPTVGVLVV